MARYILYRNRLHHVLRVAKKQHYNNIIDQNRQNLSKVYKVINGIIGKKYF